MYLRFFEIRATEHYKLDPSYFCTATGFAWQVLLKTSSEKCEHEAKRKDCELCLDKFNFALLRVIDMILMFEKGI